MTTDKLCEVLARYAHELAARHGVVPVQLSEEDQATAVHDTTEPHVRQVLLAHLHWMARKCLDDFIPSGEPDDILKANRWLGYIQGEMRAMGLFSIAELRDHSRPDNPIRGHVFRFRNKAEAIAFRDGFVLVASSLDADLTFSEIHPTVTEGVWHFVVNTADSLGYDPIEASDFFDGYLLHSVYDYSHLAAN